MAAAKAAAALEPASAARRADVVAAASSVAAMEDEEARVSAYMAQLAVKMAGGPAAGPAPRSVVDSFVKSMRLADG